MKFKKILAIVAAASMAISAFSSVAMAGSFGSPVLTGAVEAVDLSDDFGDAAYANCLAVTVSYSGFEGFSAYKAMTGKGVGITAAQVKLGYDTEKLTYIATLDGDFADGTAGGTDPVMAYGWANASMKIATSGDFMISYFLVNDGVGVDFTNESVTFTFEEYEFTVTNSTSKTSFTTETYGNIVAGSESMTAEAFTYGSSAPSVEYVNVTTDGNVEGVADGQVEKGSKIAVSAKEVAGKTATLYANGNEIVDGAEYEFLEDVSFTVVYEDIVVPVEYNYSIVNSGYRASEKAGKEDVFYKLNISAIAEGAKALLATVATKNFEVPLAAPVVEGAVDVDFTFMFLGVPADVFGTTQDSVNGQFTAFGTDNQEYEAK